MTKNYNTITLTLDEVGGFLAKFTENSEHVYWISSPDFRKIEYVSPSYERIWGRSREELYQNPDIWINFLHPDDAINHHPIEEMANQIIRLGDKARYSEQYRIIRPDGEIRWIMDNGFPLYDDKGVCFGVTGIAIDVTKQKKQEEALRMAKEIAEKASYAKDEFIQNMSHDIRTPLTGIIGMANLLEQEVQQAQEKEYAKMIEMSGEQLLSLFNSVLDIVSSASSKENLVEAHSFDFYELIKGICELELPTIKVKNLELHLAIDSSVPKWIITDSIKVHRIILNLLSNAIKFTQQGSIKINVRGKPLEHPDHVQLELTLSDSGIGIPTADQCKIFDRFYRASPSSKGLYIGHGVGLHIVQKYIELLQGTITVESNVNQGTSFNVMIPALVDRLKIESDPEHYNASSPKNAKFEEHWVNNADPEPIPQDQVDKHSEAPLLLLVEDNIIALKMVESITKQAHCRYKSAQTGEEALELMKQYKFDLILSDIGLPGISGSELTLAIRASEHKENRPATPIVGLTAHAVEAVKRECLIAGMSKVMMKPIKLKTLQNIINEHIKPQEHSVITTAASSAYAGTDLPASVDELFELNAYILLEGKNELQERAALKELLELFINESLPQDLKKLDKAYAQKNWAQIEQIAKKIKTEAVYCGTHRLKFASQYLELSYKGDPQLADILYKQLCTTVTDTILAILDWLAKQPD